MNKIEQIQQWCGGEWVLHDGVGAVVTELAIDSRSIEQPGSALFVCLVTPLRNAHVYVGDAVRKGVRSFLVSEGVSIAATEGVNVIRVKDTLVALQQIATAHRRCYDLPVIGITGSNGKTIVKEWLAELLGDDKKIVRSPKSYNSQIGVPLSVWLINEGHELGIFEAGISQPGEMVKLQPMIAPTIGVFTNIGAAHSEGFVDMRQKVEEKLGLFVGCETLVYCTDNPLVQECVLALQARRPQDMRLMTWSKTGEAVLTITDITPHAGQTVIRGRYEGRDMEVRIPMGDEAAVENAIHCWCVLLLLGYGADRIAERMGRLQQVSMRMEMKHGINDCTIINDTYNSDLTSLQLALNYLEQQRQHRRHTVILSDILQPGKSEESLYEEVAMYVARRKIERFVGIGAAISRNREAFVRAGIADCSFYESTEAFLSSFHLLTFEHEAILLKGARVFAFEKISKLMEQKVHQTVMQIDLGALRQNLDVYRAGLNVGVKTMAMVKAFAYGSGSYEIASLLQYAGVDYLTVAYTDEGVTLRKAGIRMPIMVMSPEASSFDRMIAWQLEPELYNFRSVNAFVRMAETLGKKEYPVHIKLDTGMHRLGFERKDMGQLVAMLQKTETIKIASIFSHLAASDDAAEDAFTAHQARLYEEMSDSILQAIPYLPLRHLCNTAGITRHRHLQYSMVRLGLGLYGIDSSTLLKNKLQHISTLKTSIAQIRDVPAGDSIGYGHKTFATQDMRLATISIGYADGYPRSMGHGKAHVLINGQPAPTVGIICMDMCMVDITDLANVNEGDEVIVMGSDLPATQLARWADTISYEIMAGISQRVKRVYVNGE